jgi:hypothetical protein
MKELNLLDLYSSGEEVLREYDGTPPSLLGATYDMTATNGEA